MTGTETETRFPEGSTVDVTEPFKDYDGDWFLPGETLYVLEDRGPSRLISVRRVHVRCPASGADGWLDPEQLKEKP